MPHVSKRKISEKAQRQLEDFIIGFLTDPGSASRKRIFKELLTPTEQVMLAKRFGMVFFLGRKASIYQTSELLKVSPSTVARFGRKLEAGGFPRMSAWLKTRAGAHWMMTLLTDLMSIPFEARRKSLWRFLKEE